MTTTYRTLQAQVRALREQGYTAPKLNSKAAVLAAFIANPGTPQPTTPVVTDLQPSYKDLQAQVRVLRDAGNTTPKLNATKVTLAAYLLDTQNTTTTIETPMPEPTATPIQSMVNPHLPLGQLGPEASPARKREYIEWALEFGQRRGTMELECTNPKTGATRHRFNPTEGPKGKWY